MTEAAKEARRKYQREYYARTRERQKEYHERYWTKKAVNTSSERPEKQPLKKAETVS